MQRILIVPATRSGLIDTLQCRSRKSNPNGSKRESLIKRVDSWNKVPASPGHRSRRKWLHTAVLEALRPDVTTLSRLLDRDLSSWLAE